MTAMAVMPREAREWTVDDLDEIPDDGLQYELVDGVLLVSPAPVPIHQRVVRELLVLLHPRCPSDFEVFPSPLDYRPDLRTSLQPDVLVVRRSDIGAKNINRPLLLAVEVLSPSTRRKDLVLKRSVYEERGIGSFWSVDPTGPSLSAWDLVDGRYLPAGTATGADSVTLTRPFPVEVCPALLVSG